MTEGLAFRNRAEAGRVVAKLLASYAGRADVVVLGLPRGGVPVAAEVAAALGAPLDVLVVRKLGVPGQDELAMGAIASGGVRVLNRSVVDGMGVSAADIDRVTEREERELARRVRAYRGDRPPLDVARRVAVVVDDGLATGSTMRAAVEALRALGPSRIVVAVPVGASTTCAELATVADEVVCAREPRSFHAVGEWYDDFRPTTDHQIRSLLGLTPTTARSGIAAMDLYSHYERAVSSTGRVVAAVRDDQLADPTPCADWDVRTLGNHIIGASWLFAAAASGKPVGGDGEPPDYMEGDRAGAFEESAHASQTAFRRPGALERLVTLPIGSVPGQFALTLAFLDMVVHGWDLAKATGQNTAIAADLAGAAFEVAKGFVTDEVRGMGVFGAEVTVGEDAPVHERLVAFLGRRP